jgi:hypothetical protein
VGILRRLWSDHLPRRLFVLALLAGIAGSYIAFG